MIARLIPFAFSLLLIASPIRSPACAAVSPQGNTVVNADQTVLILWDSVTKMQHFVRRASFKGDTSQVGFIVPSPSRPELEESGDSVFTKLEQITAPVPAKRRSYGCSRPAAKSAVTSVVVIERKRVAGFDAVVLQAGFADDLSKWLVENGYANSAALSVWAQPYVEQKWFFVALKLAPEEPQRVQAGVQSVDAKALRISFKTEKPLFPYREPDSLVAAMDLGVGQRLLRIYLITDKACSGHFTTGADWAGFVKWSGDITDKKADLLRDLGLPPRSPDRKNGCSRSSRTAGFTRRLPGTWCSNQTRNKRRSAGAPRPSSASTGPPLRSPCSCSYGFGDDADSTGSESS